MLKIITFNIKCGGSDIYSIEHRAPLLKEVLGKYDGDLIGMQEATPEWMECIERDYGEEYGIFNQYRAKDSLESTPLLYKKSRFECLEHGHFWLSDTPSIESGVWDNYGHNRICVWAKLYDKQEGTTVAFFNTHYGFGDENQLKSGNVILNYMKAMKVDACFLTADFNMYCTAPGYKQLTEHLVDVNAATVKDTSTTFHGYAPEKRAHLTPIDFCFVTSDTVEPITSKRMDDLVNGEFPSDHFGVYSEVQVHKKLKFFSQRVCEQEKTMANAPWFMRKEVQKLRPDIVALQHAEYAYERRFVRSDEYTGYMRENAEDPSLTNPIFWKEDLLEQVEKSEVALADSQANLAVLQYKTSGEKVCVLNAHFGEEKEAFAKLIVEKLAAYSEMTVLVATDLGDTIGSPAYKVLKEAFKDLRALAAPKDVTPTYQGFYAEDAAPAIADFVFTNGKALSKPTYKVVELRSRGRILSDHEPIYSTFIME